MTNTLKEHEQIVITLGDPAGIGSEVILKALATKKITQLINPLIVGCKATLEMSYKKLIARGVFPLANPNELKIEDIPVKEIIQEGSPSKQSGEASFDWLTRATELVLEGKAKAIVTGPISKNAWHLAGFSYQGQTERLAELSGIKKASMLFTAISPLSKWRINTLLATSHIPIKTISQQLSPQLIEHKLNILLHFCQKFNPYPKLFVAGLNPHAGEEGQLGKEEINWLTPLLAQWRKKHPDITLQGPLPPDTCWISSAKAWQGMNNHNAPDGILAMYHDQALIPLKILAFNEAVNTTLELPFVRTSPDHGTAFDIAGKGQANATSMIEAIKTAWELSKPEKTNINLV